MLSLNEYWKLLWNLNTVELLNWCNCVSFWIRLYTHSTKASIILRSVFFNLYVSEELYQEVSQRYFNHFCNGLISPNFCKVSCYPGLFQSSLYFLSTASIFGYQRCQIYKPIHLVIFRYIFILDILLDRSMIIIFSEF